MTSASADVSPRAITAIMVAAVALTVGAIILILSSVPAVPRPGAAAGAAARAPEPRRPLGAAVTLRAGDRTVSRALPTASLDVGSGAAADPELPEGPFTAVVTVTFSPGAVRYARLGAGIRGGSLIVRRRGEIIASDYAGDDPRRVLTTVPASLPGPVEQIVYEFRADAGRRSSFEALWQPESEDAPRAIPLPRPLPGSGT